MQTGDRRPAIQSLVVHFADNVGVALAPLRAGERHQGVTLRQDIPTGHKFALADLAAGDSVVKYRFPIGRAITPITAGDWVHTHNCATGLSTSRHYAYRPDGAALPPYTPPQPTFAGYPRADGRVGIRNELWILPLVGCVNGTGQRLADAAAAQFGHLAPDGVHCFAHPHGCSQLGEDHENTRQILAALARHPNAGGVLVLGLGCEVNGMAAFRRLLGPAEQARIKFLTLQDTQDEIEAGMALLAELAARIRQEPRVHAPISKLVIGLKCGASDGLSGITANPLLGAVSDALISCGASTVLTEVPEMFGAEPLLMNRCRDVRTFAKAVELIDGFEHYLQRYGREIDANPLRGDLAGGITTQEEMSLACIQKGGIGPVADVLPYGGEVREAGLNLLSGPGNDLCAVTALAAAGCQAILFSTGRGTPAGAPVPVIKVSSNSALAVRKPHWIDFDAGPLVDGLPMVFQLEALMADLLAVAGGRQTRSEINGQHDMAILKDGVTL
jgi:altronate hydrolase